jgi:hypothetical protein
MVQFCFLFPLDCHQQNKRKQVPNMEDERGKHFCINESKGNLHALWFDLWNTIGETPTWKDANNNTFLLYSLHNFLIPVDTFRLVLPIFLIKYFLKLKSYNWKSWSFYKNFYEWSWLKLTINGYSPLS